VTGYGGILRWRGHAWAVTITGRWPWIHVRSVRRPDGARMAGYHVAGLAPLLPGIPPPAGDLPPTKKTPPPVITPRGGILLPYQVSIRRDGWGRYTSIIMCRHPLGIRYVVAEIHHGGPGAEGLDPIIQAIHDHVTRGEDALPPPP
jgi:hypothetical protein